jgi:hypothetical protein
VARDPRFGTHGASPRPARCRSSVVEHSLGKGEVESSILSGSTSLSRRLAKQSLSKLL